MSLGLGQQACRRFSQAEILLATSYFDESKVIGKGGYGMVYKGHIDNHQVVAIKRLFYSPTRDSEFKDEIEMVSEIRHCHLISLIGYCDHNEDMILVYEYMPHGSLDKHLHRKNDNRTYPPLPWEKRLKICIGAARGLDYLHYGIGVWQRIIHRDVKSANILLDADFEAKIADFGLSIRAPSNQSCSYVIDSKVRGTPAYLDPEYSSSGKLTKESDVYSFGVVLLEILCGKQAYDPWVQQHIKHGRLDDVPVDYTLDGEIPHKSLKDFADIVQKCLQNKASKRPTMTTVLHMLLTLSEQHKNYATDSSIIRNEFLEDNGRGYDTETEQYSLV